MGTYVSAKCPCGFSQECRIGGGISSHQTDSLAPYLCEQCGIVSVNVKADKLACPKRDSHIIHPYASSYKARRATELHEKRIYGSKMRLHRRILRWILRQPSPSKIPQTDVVVNWGDYEILDQFFSCPSCKCETMKFHHTGQHFD